MRNSLFLNHIRRISTLVQRLHSPNFNSDCAILKSIRISNSNAFYHQSAAEYASDNDAPESQPISSSLFADATTRNIQGWKSKFQLLMENENEKELVSKKNKDRRDFEHISTVASKMGLYSHQYERYVVFSKVPLPNYRQDLDDKRPQRVVDLDFVVQERVEYHLKAYFCGKSGNAMRSNQVVNQVGMNTSEILQDWQSDLFGFTKRIIGKKNLELRKRQQDWQQCCEGQKMLEFRKSLPAYKERETLLAAVSQNQVVVVSGETGCGKTTQLPQYILESEIEADRGATCNIICTQPRRISAMTVSERVADERGEILGGTVGYKVRIEGMRGKDTRLLFCTTGILLRRLLSDRELEGVTHIIVDEIHERGINEDFLLIVLKDLLPCKPNLKVVLMSATLNADLFSSYFGDAPIIRIPGFTFPVQTYFLEHILALTGYKLTPHNQIDNYESKKWINQKQAERKRKSQIATFVEDPLRGANFSEFNRETQDSLFCWNADSVGFNLIEHVLCHICKSENPGAVLVFMTGWEDINTLKDQLKANSILGDPSRVLLLPCHGSMSSQEQKLIFNKPKDGIRKIVLATNVAETSITINDVVFVVDCGKAKETSYDALNDIPCLLPSWISKAAAKQRRGRAGRVQAGVCYHLYPRVVHDDAFSEYQLPEILRTPLHSLCLQIKTLQVASISEFLNKALQPPEPLSVNNAIEYLKVIGAFDENENLTALGDKLSMLPVEPKLGKMLVYGAIFNCLDPILTIVAGLCFKDPFALQFDQKVAAESAKVNFSAHDFSDHLAIVRAYDGWKEAERTLSGNEYCRNNFLSSQSLGAVELLRKQFISVLMDIGLVDDVGTCNMWSQDCDLVCSIICAGLFPDICSVVNNKKSIMLKTREDGQVVLVSSSVNSKPPEIPQPWIVYNEKVKVISVYIWDTTAVSDSMVLLFGGSISAARLEEKYGHLTMLGGYYEFFTRRSLADTYLILKRELDEYIHMKLLNPNMGLENYSELLSAVRFLVREDQSKNKSVFDYQPTKDLKTGGLFADGGDYNNSKTKLRTLLASAGHLPPTYTTVQSRNDNFITLVSFNGFNFTGPPCSNEKEAEKSAACKALLWLIGERQSWEKTSGRRTFLESAETQGEQPIVGILDGLDEEETPTLQNRESSVV